MAFRSRWCAAATAAALTCINASAGARASLAQIKTRLGRLCDDRRCVEWLLPSSQLAKDANDHVQDDIDSDRRLPVVLEGCAGGDTPRRLNRREARRASRLPQVLRQPVRHKAEAEKIFAGIRKTAGSAGISVDAVVAESDDVHKQIIAVAKRKKCDLICMASHGRRGISGVLLGSETHKVLTHSSLPVLVLR